jgi:starch synthase
MISMRYGTLPLVRETGGLKDTVDGYWDAGDKADGFSFKDFDVNGLREAMRLATDLWYEHRDTWKKLQANAMAKHFGWEESAEEYRKLYNGLLGKE